MRKVLLAGAIALAFLPASSGVATAAPKGESKMGDALDAVQKRHEEGKTQSAELRKQHGAPPVHMATTTPDGYVMIDAVAAGATSDLVATLDALGAKDVTSRGRMASALVPIDRLSDLRASTDLKFARPTLAATNVGLVTSQGDRSMRADDARDEFGVDGSKLTVGILSDSFGCEPGSLAGGPFTTVAEDIANDDLPADITILDDLIGPSCTDEGRAMAQLVHDSVPGAAIAFHTAFNGQADFAQGIVELALAGSDVIVDDVIFFAEPMFQDGIIAQAADEVARLGVPYYSSNGNRARAAHESDFRPTAGSPGGVAGTWHDFDPGAGVDLLQTVSIPPSGGLNQTVLSFQWDEPNFSVSGAPGSASDVDVVMFDGAGNPVPDCFDEFGNFVFPAGGLCSFFFSDGGVGGDAVDLFNLVSFGPPSAQIGFLVEAGPAPTHVKYVPFGFSGAFAQAEHDTQSGTGYGHNNAAGAEGVGASAFFLTEEFAADTQFFFGRTCEPACLNDFSSAGGTPVFFDKNGARLATPEVRFKPGVTAPDGGNTSFFFRDTNKDDDDGDGVFQTGEPGEFPNFFGTSAAAPAAASIAAMLIDAEDTGIKVRKKNNQVRFRMCKPEDGEREDGDDIEVSPAAVAAQVADGALLRPCDATEPQGLYNAIRGTAQNMTERASLGTGATIQTFDEVGPDGFDFDSGFGFVDAEEAVEEFLEGDDDLFADNRQGGDHGR